MSPVDPRQLRAAMLRGEPFMMGRGRPFLELIPPPLGSAPQAATPVTGPGGASSTTGVYASTTTGADGLLPLSPFIQANDLLVLAVCTGLIYAGGPGCTPGPPPRVVTPSGWIPLNQPIVSGLQMYAIFTRVADGTEAGTTLHIPWRCNGIGDYTLANRIFRGDGIVAPVVTGFTDHLAQNATAISTNPITGLTGSSTFLGWWATEHTFFARPLNLPPVLGDVLQLGGNQTNEVLWCGSGVVPINGDAPAYTASGASSNQDQLEAFAMTIAY